MKLMFFGKAIKTMDRQIGVSGGGFGRKGGSLLQAPVMATTGDYARSFRPSQSGVDLAEKPVRDFPKLTLQITCVVLLLFWLEALFAGTTLITPINATFQNAMRIGGFLFGIPIGYFTVTSPKIKAGTFKKILILLFMPICTVLAAEGMAWRIANWAAFGFSTSAYSPAEYPIIRANHSRKGRRDSFEINPFKTTIGTDIAVPASQFDAHAADFDDYCVTVMQRRSESGAIEILNDGRYTLHAPQPVVLTRCAAAQVAK